MITTKIYDKEATPNTLPFPKLMKSNNGQIVFFQSQNTGVLVAKTLNGKSTNQIGCSSSSWSHEAFSDFYGEVTITQVKED